MSSAIFTEVSPSSQIYVAEHALSSDACQNMIERFEAAKEEQYQGRIGQMENENLDIKRSTDLVVSGKPHWKDIDQALFTSLASGIKFMRQQHPFFSHSFSDRQLVAIWYLNDVPGPGGETEFRHQGVKIKPAQGKLVLFPPFWTHEHRGVQLEVGVKYIATTWVLFA